MLDAGRTYLGALLLSGALGVGLWACSDAGTSGSDFGGNGGKSAGSGGKGTASAGGGGGASSGSAGSAGASNEGGQAGSINLTGGSAGSGGQVPTGDPNTCEGAAALKSYVGCDYWPTVTANPVWSVFDFAAVVVNAGTETAEVTVEREGKTVATATVAPDSVAKVYLPWVAQLKGADVDTCGSPTPITKTIGVEGGAYHLVSTRPVSVYQFSALEYEGKGGPPGKDWSSCPGNQNCPSAFGPIGCFSFTNDASLLLPSTALTGNYRVSVPPSFATSGQGIGSFFTITGVEDGTEVKVQLSATGKTFAGAGIGAKGPGETAAFTINRGDVLQLMGKPGSDLSGSQVDASKPVQVIAGNPCTTVPNNTTPACDHLEQTMLPAETLGRRYVVAPITGPNKNTPGQVVRLLGNVDATALTYKGTKPAGAPDSINAGQLVDLGLTSASFEVEGDHEFLITLLMPGGSLLDPDGGKGDPSMSVSVAVEQYRTKYVFLAPDDYDINIADVIAPKGAKVTLDGEPAAGQVDPIAGTEFEVHRLVLGAGKQGSHILEADVPVGLQVMGYGSYTSYQYPGGANLTLIAPPPPDIIIK